MTPPLSRSDLARLHAAATKGPWHWTSEDHGDEYVCICAAKLMAGTKTLIGHEGITDREAPWTTDEIDADAALIVYLRNHVPSFIDLLARNEALEEVAKAAREYRKCENDHEDADVEWSRAVAGEDDAACEVARDAHQSTAEAADEAQSALDVALSALSKLGEVRG